MTLPTSPQDLPDWPTRRISVAREAVLVASILIVSRLLILAIVFLETQFFQTGSVLSQLCKWDCVWYSGIVGHGYETTPADGGLGQAGWAFFPLFPLLGRGIAALTGLTPAAAAVAASHLAFFVAAPVFYVYCRRSLGQKLAFDALLLLCFSPFSIYYSTGYTESLFLLTSVAAFSFWGQRKYLLGGIAAALALATRSVGAFIVVAFAVMALQAVPLRDMIRLKDPTLRIMAGFAIVPVGLALYMIYLYRLTGDALAFSHVQIAWRLPQDGFQAILEGLKPPGMYVALTGVATVACIVLGLYLLAIRRTAEAAFLLVGGLFAFASKMLIGTGMDSMPRYVFGLFPAYIGLAGLLAWLRIPRAIYLPAAACLQGFYIMAWIVGQYFVM